LKSIFKKKLLFLGGGYADVPLIKASKRLGYYVITSGNNANDVGHKYADEYQYVDFSKKNEVLQLAKKLKIDRICPNCNDFSAISSAYVAEILNLGGHDPLEICEILHHKDKFRSFAKDHDIPTVPARSFKPSKDSLNWAENVGFPLLVKPVDMTGGKGISKVNNSEEINYAYKKAVQISHSKRVLIEKFIEGSNHGFSAILKKKKVVFAFTDNEHYYLNPFMVSAASTPTFLKGFVRNKLIKLTEKIANILSLVDGIVHIQYIYCEDEPIIIEICRRPPGDLYVTLVEMATNFSYSMEIVKGFAGITSNEKFFPKHNGFFIRHCVMAPKNGIIRSIHYDKSLDIKENFKILHEGSKVSDYLVQKVSIIFVQFKSLKEMKINANKINKFIKFEMC